MSTSARDMLLMMSNLEKAGGAQITMSGSSGVLRIQGRNYSLDDATAVNGMTPADRELFWSACSDEGKNSDLYRTYADSLLKSVQIRLENVSSSQARLLYVKNAQNIADLGKYYASHGVDGSLNDLFNPKDPQFAVLINHTHDVKTLLKGLIEQRYPSPTTILKSIEPAYLEVILKQSYSATELIKGLEKIGYKALNLLITIEVEKLNYLLANQYNALEVMKGFVRLGIHDPLQRFLMLSPVHSTLLVKNHYNSFEIMKGFVQLGYSQPIDKFFALSQDQLTLLLNNHYNCFEVMKALRDLEYRDPFTTFFAVSSDRRQQLIANHYNIFQLIKLFKNFREVDPLQTFLTINSTIATLFLSNTYAATEIMKALYTQGKNPLPYLEKLGTAAIETMLRSQYEYVTRIKRGVNLELEFLQGTIVNKNNTPQQATGCPQIRAYSGSFFSSGVSGNNVVIGNNAIAGGAVALGPGSVARVIRTGGAGTSSAIAIGPGSFASVTNISDSVLALMQDLPQSSASISVPVAVPSSNVLNSARSEIDADLRDYLDSFDANKESFRDAFGRLELDAEELKCFCPVTLEVPNRPVRVGGSLFDYETLIALPENPVDGTRANPLTRRPFHMDQIQPDRDCKARIEGIIKAKESTLALGSLKL